LLVKSDETIEGVKTRIKNLADLNLVEVDVNSFMFIFKGIQLADSLVFGTFKEEDFKFDTKFHIFIRNSPKVEAEAT